LHCSVCPEDFAVEVRNGNNLPVGVEGAAFEDECKLAGEVADCGVDGQDLDSPVALDTEAECCQW